MTQEQKKAEFCVPSVIFSYFLFPFHSLHVFLVKKKV